MAELEFKFEYKEKRMKKMRKASETKVFKPPRIEITGVLKREEKGEKITAENFSDLVKNIHLNSRCSTNATLDKHRDTPAHHSQTVGNRQRVSRKEQEKTT